MSEPTKSPDGNREKVRAEVVDIISNRLGVGKEQITDATTFQEDLGADSLDVVELVMELEEKFKIQIPDEEAEKIKRKAGYKARRCVVEGTHSWINRFRGILIRWNKKAENYVAMLHLAFAIIAYRGHRARRPVR